MRSPISAFRARTALLTLLALLMLTAIGFQSLTVRSVFFDRARQQAPYMNAGDNDTYATVNLTYRGYGDTSLTLTPRDCLMDLHINNHPIPLADNKPWCGERTVDLAPWLKPGRHNMLTAHVGWQEDYYLPQSGLAVGSSFFATTGKTLCTLVLLASLAGILWQLLAKAGWDRPTRLIFTGALGVYLQALCHISVFDYSQDIERHISYLAYVTHHFFTPYRYDGFENWHPPTYYWLCSIIARSLSWFGTFNEWQAIRLFSVICYAAFLYYGIKSFARLLHGTPFYIASLLLAFWPSGIIDAVRINNDVLFYPCYAACFYYMLVWFQTLETKPLSRALIACALGFTVKMTALVPLGIVGCTALYLMRKKRWAMKAFFQPALRPALILMALGIVCNKGKNIYFLLTGQETPELLGPGDHFAPSLADLFSVHPGALIAAPFFDHDYGPPLWENQLRAMLFNNLYWQYPLVASCIMALFLVMLAYVLVYLLRRGGSMFPVTMGIILPFAATYLFLFSIHMPAATDFHYIHPVLIAFILAFGLTLKEGLASPRRLFYYPAYGVSLMLVLLFIGFTQLQWI